MRRVLVRTILLCGLASVVTWLSVAHVPALTDDFIAYWSTARLLAHGRNPYDPDSLLAVQRSAGWLHSTPLPIWYGPWIVGLTIPIGLLPYWPGRISWLTLQIVFLLVAASVSWGVYDGPPDRRRPFLLAATFAPAIMCLVEGQITPFMLLGFVLFLRESGRGKDWFAGLALFPLTAKPAIVYLIWPALLLWTFRSGRVRVLCGCALSVAIGSGVALALNPEVFDQWLRFGAETSPLVQAYTPTVGSVLRYIWGADRVWLAYISAIIGTIWWLARCERYNRDTDWRDELPKLAVVSLLTAPFAWSHDALLLFPAVIQVAVASRSRVAARFWFLSNAASVASYPFLRYRQTWYLLYPIVLEIWRRSRYSKADT
jgi:hypothetical protein